MILQNDKNITKIELSQLYGGFNNPWHYNFIARKKKKT